MTDVCVYTANFGAYDTPRPHLDQDIECDWRYFHDGQRPPPAGWLDCQTTLDGSAMMRAKWWKMHPPVGYEWAVWIDANMEITSQSFVREALDTIAFARAVDGGAGRFALFKHPRRDDLFDEIAASLGAESQGGKYDEWVRRMIEQGEAYERAGMPEHHGLYACGTIVWTPEAWPISRAWWDECVFWTPQDQVSLPFVCWARDEYPAVFPFDQLEWRADRAFGNRWFIIHPHA